MLAAAATIREDPVGGGRGATGVRESLGRQLYSQIERETRLSLS